MYGSVLWWSASFFLLALMISFLSSYMMFSVISNFKRNDGEFRPYWLAGGAFIFGVGLWSKHFVVVLAYNQPLYISWNMLAGLFFIIFFSMTGFLSLAFQGVFRRPLMVGSMILAFGIAFMTYFSLLSQPFENLHVQPLFLALSLAVLYTGAYGSFRLSEKYSERHRWTAALLLGLSVMLEQLLAMETIRTKYTLADPQTQPDWEVNLLSLIVGIAALLLLMSTMLTWYIDKRLSQMDERYRLLVENSMDMIAIVEGDKWKYINAAGLRLLEADKPEEVLGKPVWSFLPEEAQESAKQKFSNQLLFHGRPFEQAMYTLKGKMLYTEIVETPTTLGSKPVLQVIVRDISERKKNEELLVNSEKLFVAGQLAAGIAHEIRNPLTSLKGFLHLIATGQKNDPRYYEIMNAELDRIDDIVSELLMLSKPQVYELNYHDLRMIMRDTITLLETQAHMHNIEIAADYGAEPLWVYGVENQLKQVMINILKNAIEAMSDGGTIKVRMMRFKDEVYVQIQDQGPGIGEEHLAKIGQPFYTTKEKGTGLGLMVSYKIVDNHHGRVNVNSQIGEGTMFEIMLPFRYPEEASTSS